MILHYPRDIECDAPVNDVAYPCFATAFETQPYWTDGTTR